MATVIFTSMPALPQAGVTADELKFLSAVRDNLQLLIGGNPKSLGNAAIVRGSISVAKVTTVNLPQVTSKGGGFTISGVNVASGVEFNKLVGDVQKLLVDVDNLRITLNTLVGQLKV